MKERLSILLAVLLGLLSCSKTEDSRVDVSALSDIPIAFDVESISVTSEPETKVTPTTAANLNSFYAVATTGTTPSDKPLWTSTLFTKDGTTYKGGKYWTLNAPAGGYHFFASNLQVNSAANSSSVTVTVPNATSDYVGAYLPTTAFQGTNQLSFKHLFARCGNVTVTAEEGYTISNVEVHFLPYTTGVFDLRSIDSTDGTGWSSLGGNTSQTVFGPSGSPGTVSNDIYLVPGSYRLYASWKAVKGDYSRDYSNVASGEIPFVGGKINRVSVGLKGNAAEILLSVSVSEWVTAPEQSPTFSFD